MFNVTVLKIGDIIKYLVGISIIVMLMVFTARYFSSTKENKNTKNFKILQLTDTQIIDPSRQPYEGRLKAEEAETWKDRDKCVFNLIRRLIERVSPDYIVLTGDNVYGQFDADGSNFIAFVNFMESFRIPWSFVNGNHDGEY